MPISQGSSMNPKTLHILISNRCLKDVNPSPLLSRGFPENQALLDSRVPPDRRSELSFLMWGSGDTPRVSHVALLTVSHVCLCPRFGLQGLPGPQGLIGAPGDKVGVSSSAPQFLFFFSPLLSGWE